LKLLNLLIKLFSVRNLFLILAYQIQSKEKEYPTSFKLLDFVDEKPCKKENIKKSNSKIELISQKYDKNEEQLPTKRPVSGMSKYLTENFEINSKVTENEETFSVHYASK